MDEWAVFPHEHCDFDLFRVDEVRVVGDKTYRRCVASNLTKEQADDIANWHNETAQRILREAVRRSHAYQRKLAILMLAAHTSAVLVFLTIIALIVWVF